MKHIKLFERRNFRDYQKYIDICQKKFKQYVRIEKFSVYKENDKIIIEFKTWGSISQTFFNYINSEFGQIDYDIIPSNGGQLIVILKNIPESYLDELELEIAANKYNL